MKARRILLVLAAIAMFLGSAPAVAGDAVGVPTVTGHTIERSASEETPRREAPKVATLGFGHRGTIAASGTSPRSGASSAKVRALCAGSSYVAASAGRGGVDVEADARLLRSSNTPCSVRGPPTAA